MPLRKATDATPLTTDGTYYRTWNGGRGVFRANGTWDGATITLSVLSPDGTNYDAIGSDTTLTADGNGQFVLDDGARIAQIISDDGASTSLYTVLAEVPE